jgi:putative nucleotidyltransferase with HDIG domain
MAAYWIRNCRERKVFIAAGAKLGLLSIILVTAVDFYLAELSGPKLLWDWAFAFLGGIGAGIVTAGLAPLVEIAFGYTTDISLLEQANLDRPILRKLMIEAPGTYHHSVIVGSLVEAAASEIGANHLLAKVCGYYHDIGKIKKPLYFIENQKAGKNKHDKLAPSMSSLILIAHVKDGVEIARKNKLGQVIVDTIRQHHGTSLIKFFYEKAKLRKGEDAVNIDDFRYPGPKPQTREAGLVMLADVVEAASRTLENPTPARIQGLVQNLINNIFSDGQLDECELTLKDLHKIARSFNQILNGIHHHRIEYTEKWSAASETVKGRPKNGSPDRQQAKQAHNLSEEDRTNGSGHLKRLGLSERRNINPLIR